MATLQFDLVSPERKLASMEATEIEIPGSEGDFAAMGDHAPVLTTLRPGILRVKAGNDVTEYVVTGGFVELSSAGASVLAEQAMPKSETERSTIEAMIEDAKTAGANLEGTEKDLSDKRIADFSALLDQL